MMVKCLYELSLEHFVIHNLDCPTYKDGNMTDLVLTNNSRLPSITSLSSLLQIMTTTSSTALLSTAELLNQKRMSRKIARTGMKNSVSIISTSSMSQSTRTLSVMNLATIIGQENRFTSACLQIAQKWVPVRKAPPHAHHNRPKIPRHRRALMQRRTRLRKCYISAKTEVNRQALLQKLIHIEKDLQKSHCDQRKLEERKAIEKIKTNPKFFFTFGKKFLYIWEEVLKY